jgi:hypothetical protein
MLKSVSEINEINVKKESNRNLTQKKKFSRRACITIYIYHITVFVNISFFKLNFESTVAKNNSHTTKFYWLIKIETGSGCAQ